MSRRVLITGGTGFVGSHAIEAFANAGWKVRATVRNPARIAWARELRVEIHAGSLDSPDIRQAVESCDLVVHCAAVTKTPHREEFYRVNSEVVESLAKAGRAAGVRRFVLCSTHAASGPAANGVASAEDDLPSPLTDYGKSKLEGEERLKTAAGAMEWIILRPPSILGPRDQQFLPLFRGIVRWGLYPRFGSESRNYSYIYVKDFVRAFLMASEAQSGMNETYFVAHPDVLDWERVSSSIARLLHRKVRPLRVPEGLLKTVGKINDAYARITGKAALLSSEKVREILAGPWICSSAKITRAWGFRCEYSTEQALKETLDYYRQAGSL